MHVVGTNCTQWVILKREKECEVGREMEGAGCEEVEWGSGSGCDLNTPHTYEITKIKLKSFPATQWMKRLWYKHEDLNLDSQHPHESG